MDIPVNHLHANLRQPKLYHPLDQISQNVMSSTRHPGSRGSRDQNPVVRRQCKRAMRALWLLVLSLAWRMVLGLPRARRAPVADSATDMTYVRDCNQTDPVSLSVFNEVLVHKRLDGAEDDSEQYKFQCFLHCLFTKYGWMDEEGGFLLAEMRRVLEETLNEPQILHGLLYECTAMALTDRCRRALQFTRCFWEKLDQHQHPEESYYVYNLEEPPEEDWLH